jgi:hypothetical protein
MQDAMKIAFGGAVHFDTELVGSPEPFVALVRSLFGESPGGAVHWYTPIEGKRSPAPAPLDVDKLVQLIGRGVAFAAVETAPATPDSELVLARAAATPIAQRPERFSQTKCRYSAELALGAAALHRLGAQRVLDAFIAFAGAVRGRAGVVHWADSAAYASCLASCGGSEALSREQIQHIADLMYWQPRWGEVIRGPAWGTFLGADHVDRLGGLARIERESGCARVVGLASGGAFLQATPIDAPLVEGHADRGVLDRLAGFLAPVMGQLRSVGQ